MSRLERPEQQVGLGHAEHGEDVLGRDAATAVGDELLERAERVAERARRVAGQQRDRVGAMSISSWSATRRTTAASCSAVGREKSKR